MSDSRVYQPEDLIGMTDAEIIKVLDTGWPWPLDSVQEWFESLWNNISSWIDAAKQWIVDQITPLVDPIFGWIEAAKVWIVENVSSGASGVWDWIGSAKDIIISSLEGLISQVLTVFQDGLNWIIKTLGPYFDWLWKWLQDAFSNLWSSIQPFLQDISNQLNNLGDIVGSKVAAINDWFSNEFIDPFIDWLLQFPKNLTGALEGLVNGLATRLEAWLGHHSPGFPGILLGWLQYIWDTIKSSTNWSVNAQGGLLQLIGQVFVSLAVSVGSAVPAIWDALAGVFSGLGTRVQSMLSGLGGCLSPALQQFGGWFANVALPYLKTNPTQIDVMRGAMQVMIDKIVTPAIDSIMSWAAAQGPIAPSSAVSVAQGVTKLATFTISGLAAMTIAGELLHPLKQLGLGNVSAVIYDLINYRTLTAAFMGVLAGIYIRTPLTYYYNKLARPNLPGEGTLRELVSEQLIGKDEFINWMGYHGYTDDWSAKMYETIYRPATPYLLRSMAEAGILDDNFLEDQLRSAGYNPRVIPYIKQMMNNLATGADKSVLTGVAMTRFKEGFIGEDDLRYSLSTLGVTDRLMDKYIFAAELQYLTDYQVDVRTYYIDAYHRREIEETDLRSGLTSAGMAPDRIDLIVQAQQIKRLKAPAAPEPPELKIQEETIRMRRDKNLITRDQEIQQLVDIGKEIPYALAISNQDDVKLTKGIPTNPPPNPPRYETEAGKLEVDTARRMRRSGQLTPDEEFQALQVLGMPAETARAVVDNDTVRITKSTDTSGGAT